MTSKLVTSKTEILLNRTACTTYVDAVYCNWLSSEVCRSVSRFLPWAVQKWLNQSVRCLGYGLGWAERSISSIVFARWHQCPHMAGHIDATWRIRLNHLSGAPMRCHVKLLWLLVSDGNNLNQMNAENEDDILHRLAQRQKKTYIWLNGM